MTALPVCLCLAGSSLAEQPHAELADWPLLTLEQALKIGLERNLDLQAEALNVPISKEGVVAQNARFDITLNASAGTGAQKMPTSSAFSGDEFSRQRDYKGEVGLEKNWLSGMNSVLSLQSSRLSTNSTVDGLDPQYQTLLVLDLTQPLLRDFGFSVNSADIRLAQNTVEQARQRYLNQAQELARSIEEAYYDLSAALSEYRFRLESQALAEELLEGNRQKLEVGVIPVSEVQEAETALANREEQVQLALQQVEIAGNTLKNILEIRWNDLEETPFFRTEPLPQTFSELRPLKAALSDAMQLRPDLKRQQLEVAGRNIRLAFQRNQTLPRLDLKTTLGVNGLSGDTRDNLSEAVSQEGNYFDSAERLAEGDGYEWFAGIRFSYPLGNREAQARLRQADMEKRQAIFAVKRLENTIETEVLDAMVQVNRSRERIAVAGRFESLAQTTLEQEMERLAEGLSNTFRVLDFQEDVIDARIRRLTARRDYYKGLAQLNRVTGTNLQEVALPADLMETHGNAKN